MLKSCPYCGRVHDTHFDCGKKPKRKQAYVPGTKRVIRDEERGRYTEAWKKKSKQIKEDALWMCELCADNGVISTDRLQTHHITPLLEDPDGLLDDGNLICLCWDCHKKADSGLIPREKLRKLANKRGKHSPGVLKVGNLGEALPNRGPL